MIEPMTPTPTEVEIHEFSTGIRPERTADGRWVSLGFTGQYMNATLEPIPRAVQRSIANKEFAVAEGASSSEPAVIGRVVSGGEESDWSVVAIVTRGRDEKGRSTSVYRYFLSEGGDSLCRILAWIESQRQNERMPVFNPFETKVVGQPNISMVPAPSFEHLLPKIESLHVSESVPVIIQPGQYTEQIIIHKLATEKAKTNGQPVAWAFMVEALEQPGRFQVIHAASNRAYELLQRAKVNTPQITAPVADEQAIKSAIKGLISSSRVKPEHVQAIANSLGDTSIPEGYWKEIFDGQGAANALKQGIYSPQMVRLLTLRAIVIPEMLPGYLAWLEKGNKQNEPSTVSTEFQSQIRNSLSQISDTAPNIEVKVTEGVKLLLLKLLDRKVSVETVIRLLTSKNGLWMKFHHQLIQNIDNDLQLMSRFSKGSKDLPFKLTDNTWQSIWRDLRIYWRQRSYPPEAKYQSLAELFSQLNHPKISAVFYYVGYGKVPKKIFTQLGIAGWQHNIYGVVVEREVTISESLWFTIIDLGSNIVPVPIVILIMVLSLAFGFAGGKFLPLGKSNSSSNNTTANTQGSSPQPQANPPPSPKPAEKSQICQILNTSDKYSCSFYMLSKIVYEISILNVDTNISPKLKKEKVINEIQEVVGIKEVEFDLKTPGYFTIKPQSQTALKNAIIKYQKQRNSNNITDGVINEDDNTYNLIKCDVAKKLNIPLENELPICNKATPV